MISSGGRGTGSGSIDVKESAEGEGESTAEEGAVGRITQAWHVHAAHEDNLQTGRDIDGRMRIIRLQPTMRDIHAR